MMTFLQGWSKKSLILIALLFSNIFSICFSQKPDPAHEYVQKFTHEVQVLLVEGKFLKALEKFVKLEEEISENEISLKDQEDLFNSAGNIYLSLKAYDLGANFFKKANESHLLRTGKNDFMLLGAIAVCYMENKNWEEASCYFFHSLSLSYQLGEKSRIATNMNNIGMYYMEKGVDDSAEFYFNGAIEEHSRISAKDTVFPGSIRDNLARIYEKRRDYSAALELYDRNFATYQNFPSKKDRFLQAILGQADMLLKLKKPSLAKKFLNQAEELISEIPAKQRNILEGKWLDLEIQYHGMFGKAQDELLFLRKKIAFQASLLIVERNNFDNLSSGQLMLAQIEMKRREEIQSLRLMEKEARLLEMTSKSRNAFNLFIIIMLTVLILSASVFVWFYLRSLTLKKQVDLSIANNNLLNVRFENEKLENENLELKVKLKEQDLINFALENKRKKELLKKIELELKSIKAGSEMKEKISSLINTMNIQLQTDTTSSLYHENISEVNAEFRARLLKRFPPLTQKEIELCGMVRLGLQIKEIAAMRNVTENAIQVARKRLRKKLLLLNGEDLTSFLVTI